MTFRMLEQEAIISDGVFGQSTGIAARSSAGGLAVAAIGLGLPAAMHGRTLVRRRRQRARTSAYERLPDLRTMTVSEARSSALSKESGLSMRRLFT